LTTSVLMDRPTEVEVYMKAMDRLSIVSLDAEQSIDLLDALRSQLD
jgi:hypothetical protein